MEAAGLFPSLLLISLPPGVLPSLLVPSITTGIGVPVAEGVPVTVAVGATDISVTGNEDGITGGGITSCTSGVVMIVSNKSASLCR